MIDQLPAELRQRALYGGVGQEDDDEEQEEDEDDDRWGKKKTYWSGDTADLEIGQDIEDAEDEETAAKVCFHLTTRCHTIFHHPSMC